MERSPILKVSEVLFLLGGCYLLCLGLYQTIDFNAVKAVTSLFAGACCLISTSLLALATSS